MAKRQRIYFDHAATSWPKDDAVLDAMHRFARDVGATSGRGGYASASAANAIVANVRHAIAGIIHAEDDACVSIHDGGTSALNTAIHGVLRNGDHVVTTAAEHNSVLRPIHHWQSHRGVHVTVVPTDEHGIVSADDVIAAVTDTTRLVTLTHASNVTGAVQPIGVVGRAIQRDRLVGRAGTQMQRRSVGHGIPVRVQTRPRPNHAVVPGRHGQPI
jgi:selenocysteine lyase/cysteine desulfurase